jgi:hypothetical protein
MIRRPHRRRDRRRQQIVGTGTSWRRHVRHERHHCAVLSGLRSSRLEVMPTRAYE